MHYLEPAGGPVFGPMGSMVVWAGIPRLDQLSWGWSMDKHADELSDADQVADRYFSRG